MKLLTKLDQVTPFEARTIASVLSGKLKIKIIPDTKGQWNYDFEKKAVLYNERDLAYLDEKSVVAHFLHETGHAKYSVIYTNLWKERPTGLSISPFHRAKLKDLINIINNFRIEDRVRAYYPYAKEYLPTYGFKTHHFLNTFYHETGSDMSPYFQYIFAAYEDLGGDFIGEPKEKDGRIAEVIEKTHQLLAKARGGAAHQDLANIVFSDIYPIIKPLLDEEEEQKTEDRKQINWVLMPRQPFGQYPTYDQMYGEIKPLIAPTVAVFKRLLTDNTFDKFEGKYRTGGQLKERKLYKFRMHDFRLFERRVEKKTKDYLFSLVVDESGSMRGAYGESGSLPENHRITQAVKTAILFSHVLEKLGIPYTIHGFNAKYRTYKRADETFTDKTKKKFESMFDAVRSKAAGWNNDGDAIVLFSKQMEQATGKRVMLVLSDGQPAPDDSATVTYYDLKQAVKVVEKKGIATIGIGIESDAVRMYYGDYIVVPKIAQLPSKMLEKLKKALRS